MHAIVTQAIDEVGEREVRHLRIAIQSGMVGKPSTRKRTGHQAIAGDFNGDGKTDIGLRDANNGMFYFQHVQSTTTFGSQTTLHNPARVVDG